MNKRTQSNLASLELIAKQFDIQGKIKSIHPYGNGLVNKTYLIETNQKKYILQQISQNMGDQQKLMSNIQKITSFLQKQNLTTMKLITTKKQHSYLEVGSKNFRLFEFFEGKVYETIESTNDFKKAGVAFAKFEKSLENFPQEELFVTLPNFHNTEYYYQTFINAVQNAPLQQKTLAQTQIDFLIANNHYVDDINTLMSKGLPKRIIHGDTKINNIIFGDNTTCVVDFDTVMQSFLCYDFGDAIRSGCNSAKENQPEQDVYFNLANYTAFTKGYLSIWNDLSALEQKSLVISPLLVTYELSLRFLTDFLTDNKYFNTTYPNENLDRCKNQIALLLKMQQSYPVMQQIFYSFSHKSEKNVCAKKFSNQCFM